jgi:hypothetical protein
MQIKRVRFHLTPVRIAIFNSNNNKKCWEGCGKTRTLLYCWWEFKFVQSLWKAVWRFFKKIKIELPYDPNKHKKGYNRDTSTMVFIAAQFTIAKI